MNPYFDVTEPQVISDIETLLSLNVRKKYYRPGDQTAVGQTTVGDIMSMSSHSIPHSTAGIFRGQLYDWPLIPKSFREEKLQQLEVSSAVRSLRFIQATRKFNSFCKRAEIQNPAFPQSISDRMSIAQHFGVPTPLLDWSQNIFAAVFFAIRDVFADPKFEDSLQVFVYHVIDERLFLPGLPDDSDLADFGRSAFIKPYPIDRRIERQRGVFTYHPHLSHCPPKVPTKRYVLDFLMIQKLIDLMEGFGFTEDYFFPDYAGIAQAVMSETSL